MGRGHATSGYLGGLGMVAALPWAPWSVRLLAVAVTGGAALLPDLDTASSTASRSLGFLTRWIAHGVAWVSIEVYHATRLDGDPAARDNPHRLITHTPVGSLAFGGVVAVACLAHPIAGGVVIGLLIALGVTAVPTLHRAGNRLPGGGLAVLVVSAGGAWWVLTYENAWWWVLPVAVVWGAILHREGDWCTVQGVPRRLWPLPEGDQRWRQHHALVTWHAGDEIERLYVTPALGVATVVSATWVSGIAPWAIAAWTG